jgi:predicted nucleic acid-binding protein
VDYVEAAQRMALGEWRGGRIYDALHLRCADKVGADSIYTFNARHFQQMAPDLEGKICAP